MRYLAIITAVNTLVVAIALTVTNAFNGIPFSVSGLLFFTGITVIFGVAGGLTLGLAGVLFTWRFVPDSFVALALVGTVLGGFGGWLLSVPGQPSWILGGVLGLISACQWWFFVERFPERREYFD